jgi:hypothetical protein
VRASGHRGVFFQQVLWDPIVLAAWAVFIYPLDVLVGYLEDRYGKGKPPPGPTDEEV